MSLSGNLLGAPDPVRLPFDESVAAALDGGAAPAQVAADHPKAPAAWAALAVQAAREKRTIEAYAYARTGYHRSLDALRKNGWKGHGPVPAAHPGNLGYLTCVAVLADLAAEIGEQDEADRLAALLADSDATFDPGPLG